MNFFGIRNPFGKRRSYASDCSYGERCLREQMAEKDARIEELEKRLSKYEPVNPPADESSGDVFYFKRPDEPKEQESGVALSDIFNIDTNHGSPAKDAEGSNEVNALGHYYINGEGKRCVYPARDRTISTVSPIVNAGKESEPKNRAGLG